MTDVASRAAAYPAEPIRAEAVAVGFGSESGRLVDRRRTEVSSTVAADVCLVRWVGAAFVGLGVFLIAYLVSLVVQGESPWPLFNDWVIAGFEIVGSALCIVRGLTRRIVPITLGSALMMWAVGDLILTIESQGGAQPATPSWADACYIAFFPLAYVAVVAFLRGEVRRLATPSWLDGAVAGTGAAAACAAFAFHDLVHFTSGSSAATLTNLAYPVGDLLLLSFVVGGTTVMSGRQKAPWVLMALGITVNVVGDTANLFDSSLGKTGFVLDAMAWPTSILLMSIAVWVRPRPVNLLTPQRPNTLVIPGLSAGCALAILLVGNLHSTRMSPSRWQRSRSRSSACALRARCGRCGR